MYFEPLAVFSERSRWNPAIHCALAAEERGLFAFAVTENNGRAHQVSLSFNSRHDVGRERETEKCFI